MEILRTPDERFAFLPEYDYEPKYIEVGEFRMAYTDVGKGDPILCLHGEPSWGFLYRKMIPGLSTVGRVITPDLLGFGRSDKPANKEDFTYALNLDALESLVNQLDLKNITLVCQDWGGLLGLPLATRNNDRFARLVIMNTGCPSGEETPSKGFLQWLEAAEKMEDMPVGQILQGATVSNLQPDIVEAYDAPFPDKTYKVGAHKFPLLVPISTDMEAAQYTGPAKKALGEWTKPALVMFSDKDPVTGGGDKAMRRLIPSATNEPEITITQGGHFLQEDRGEEIAEHIIEFIQRRPITS
ncbi:MAG: haloalkane dehalogenase [Candidatus Hydrogenedentota bacterium]